MKPTLKPQVSDSVLRIDELMTLCMKSKKETRNIQIPDSGMLEIGNELMEFRTGFKEDKISELCESDAMKLAWLYTQLQTKTNTTKKYSEFEKLFCDSLKLFEQEIRKLCSMKFNDEEYIKKLESMFEKNGYPKTCICKGTGCAHINYLAFSYRVATKMTRWEDALEISSENRALKQFFEGSSASLYMEMIKESILNKMNSDISAEVKRMENKSRICVEFTIYIRKISLRQQTESAKRELEEYCDLIDICESVIEQNKLLF